MNISVPVRTPLLGRLPRRLRPGLSMSVAFIAVSVVVVMAMMVADVVAGNLRRVAADAAVHNIEAIVRGFVDPQLDDTSLALGESADPLVSESLQRLTVSGDIRAIGIWSRDGRIVYSTVDALRGQRFSIGESVATAFAGTSVSVYRSGDGLDLPIPEADLPQQVLEIFVPIRGMVDGNPIGVYMVEQNARGIEDRVEATRRDVFVIALGAASLLLIVLVLAFAGASALLARQNQSLHERAEKERSLTSDLRRSEERFRSLVRNSSDIILIVGPDNAIAYESPGVSRVLGYDAESRVGTSPYDVVHADDATWLRQRVTDLTGAAGAELTLEFRARHADGSWRWLEATAKNLLDDPAVGGIVVNYRDITDRRRLEEQLRYQAFHDALSSLPNRALFMDRLEHALSRVRRDGSSLGILFLDLDDFKAVNDGLGHAAGDELLVAVAERLRLTLRDADTAARMGGDEFAVLLEDADIDVSVEVGERIIESLRRPFTVQERDVRVHGSIGITMYTDPEQTGEELLRRADVAMYSAKSQGKDRLVVFQPDVHLITIDRAELRAEMHDAFERGEFYLVYQPVVELDSGAITGAEALLRWRHPRRGVISPAEFIPLAEEDGLIVPLGRWVLGEACRQANAWRKPDGSRIGIAVNLSGRQVYDETLVDDVAAAIRSSGMDASLLTLEITESILLRDVDVVTARLHALKGLGVKLAIDDFGTGYSSLNYLRQFPVDILKIDRSFVSGVDSGSAERAVVRSIVSLSQVLELQTIAEGIEDEAQLGVLRSLGPMHGQGFLFAEPLEASAVCDAIAGAQPIRRAKDLMRSTTGPLRARRPARSQVQPRARRSIQEPQPARGIAKP